MPELPEVETVRRDLEGEIVGRTIESVLVTGARSVRRQDREHFSKLLVGRNVEAIRRHGKFLLIDVDDDETVVAHLRMSGQLLWVTDSSIPEEKHTHIRWCFTDGSELRFVDPRTFGEMWITSRDVPDLSHLGPDALDVTDISEFEAALGMRRMSVKAAMLNQKIVAGIGNIYADETLWRAKVRPQRLVATFTHADKQRIFDSMHELLAAAVQARGSTLLDARYTDAYGQAGSAQELHKVYGREGEPCERDGRAIVRTRVAGRSTYWCSHCQK